MARRVCAKLRSGAICCLCAAVAVALAGCGKRTEQEPTNAPGPTETAGITGGAEPTGSKEPDTDPQPSEAAGGVDTEEGGAKTEEPGEETGDKEGGEISEELLLSGAADEILASFRGRTLAHAIAMLSGDFSVCDAFSAELAGQLSQRDMKAAWKQAVSGLGEPLTAAGEEAEAPKEANIVAEATFLNPPASENASGSIADFGGYVITSAQIPYEGKNIILSITYGQTGAVEGIYLTYTLPPVKPEITESYTEREVKVGEGKYPLEGILTLPNGVENPPVVLLVHGSGQSDKNETIGAAGNAPFADIAQGLAKRGIATLRYDKRYYEYPELASDTVTIRDEVLDDVAAAIALLLEMPEVDGGHIFVLGHSLGGMLAPCIVQENPQVAGMVSLAGSPRGLWEIVYDQNMAAMQAAELSESERQTLAEMVQQEYEKLLSLVADVRDTSPELSAEQLSEVLFGVPGYYWASLAQIDTAQIVQELSVPMLILQGSADFQVYPDRDFAVWQTLLEGKENVTFRLFEGLNHLFMPSGGAMDVTEYDEEAHVSQEVIDAVAEWISAVCGE